jgi:cell wall-associated NlpC family hydrolase
MKKDRRPFAARMGRMGLAALLAASLVLAMPAVPVFAADAANPTEDEALVTPDNAYQGFYDPDKIAAAQAAVEALTNPPKEEEEEEPQVILPSREPQGTTENLKLSLETILQARAAMGDGVPAQRAAAVLKGYSLLGKVDYFWAGKSLEVGWDDRWGNPATVLGETKRAGQVLPYGLDCSGFVTWCFLNAAGSCSYALEIGSGTDSQWAKSVEILWEEAQPGDLVFLQTPEDAGINHVGLLAGKDESGDWLVLHCSSAKGTVVRTGLDAGGFQYLRRPLIYGEDGQPSAYAQAVTANMESAYGADIRLCDALSAFTAEEIAQLLRGE